MALFNALLQRLRLLALLLFEHLHGVFLVVLHLFDPLNRFDWDLLHLSFLFGFFFFLLLLLQELLGFALSLLLSLKLLLFLLFLLLLHELDLLLGEVGGDELLLAFRGLLFGQGHGLGWHKACAHVHVEVHGRDLPYRGSRHIDLALVLLLDIEVIEQ